MKGEGVSEEVIDHFMNAFQALVKSNLSQEVMRSLSLYITYAFHTPTPSVSRSPRPLSSSRCSTPGPAKRLSGDTTRARSPSTGSRFLTKKQLGTRVLIMYSHILCEKGNLNNIKKFARTVTNKVRRPRRSCPRKLTPAVAALPAGRRGRRHRRSWLQDHCQAARSPRVLVHVQVCRKDWRIHNHGE